MRRGRLRFGDSEDNAPISALLEEGIASNSRVSGYSAGHGSVFELNR